MNVTLRRGALSAPPLPFALGGSAMPELMLGAFLRNAIALGRFDRLPPNRETSDVFFRRASGGRPVRIGPGVLYVGLGLPTPDALTSATSRNLLNRYVRPILRALSLGRKTAKYTGRDFILVGGAAIASVGFAYEEATGRSLVEAFIGVREPAQFPHAALRGAPATSLAALGVLDAEAGAQLEERIVRAVEHELACTVVRAEATLPATVREELGEERPFDVAVEAAIGPLGLDLDAGVLGGALMCSEEGSLRLGALARESGGCETALRAAFEATPLLGVAESDVARLLTLGRAEMARRAL